MRVMSRRRGSAGHLTTLRGSRGPVALDIRAQGCPEDVVRTVTENCRTLKFKTHGLEEE